MKRFYFGNLLAFLLFFALTVSSCSAQTEVQSLESLRQLTRDGKLPAESVVEQIERRYAGRQTGVLARLLRARIKFETKDYAGAATLLNSPEFAAKTKVGDYALWLRGQALQLSGNHAEAINVFSGLERDFPTSLLSKDAKIMAAESLLAANRPAEVHGVLAPLLESNDPDPKVFLLTGKAYELQSSKEDAARNYLWAYAYTSSATQRKEIEARIVALGFAVTVTSNTSESFMKYDGMLRLAEGYMASKDYGKAATAYDELVAKYPKGIRSDTQLQRLTAYVSSNRVANAQLILPALSGSPKEHEEAYSKIVSAYAKNKLWPQARQYAEEMRSKFPNGKLTPKAWVDAGYAARDAKNKGEENFFLQGALIAWPNAVEVAGAQFELAWMQHEAKNYAQAADMMIDHLARYANKDTTNRGKAGYWAARNAELAGKIKEACALYDAVNYRYGANWYGYIGLQRITTLQGRGECKTPPSFAAASPVAKASANLKTVTVAAETSGPNELERAEKSEQLSTIGLFDWAIDELNEAKKTAANSPKINLALAKHYKLKGDNVNALLALAKSYPDYAQMFPEEMGREEWDIFYPHVAWDQIVAWAKHRNLDMYQVAGLIRQESVFNPRARSGAQAFGLMQLLLPTARLVARKYGSTANLASAEALYQPALNIELGTGYMRDQLDKFGRIEYMAVAYNAGPGRVAPWRATLPMEMDEFVEAIPFKETKGYVQGVIRNSAQYRRLYDENGNFKPNVGTRPLRSEIDSKPRDQMTAENPDVVILTEGGE